MLIIQLIRYNICNITIVYRSTCTATSGNIRGINTHNYYTILDIHNSLHQIVSFQNDFSKKLVNFTIDILGQYKIEKLVYVVS